ncbi:hypothetical protein BOFL111202_26690 [Bordetella flabilis]
MAERGDTRADHARGAGHVQQDIGGGGRHFRVLSGAAIAAPVAVVGGRQAIAAGAAAQHAEQGALRRRIPVDAHGAGIVEDGPPAVAGIAVIDAAPATGGPRQDAGAQGGSLHPAVAIAQGDAALVVYRDIAGTSARATQLVTGRGVVLFAARAALVVGEDAEKAFARYGAGHAERRVVLHGDGAARAARAAVGIVVLVVGASPAAGGEHVQQLAGGKKPLVASVQERAEGAVVRHRYRAAPAAVAFVVAEAAFAADQDRGAAHVHRAGVADRDIAVVGQGDVGTGTPRLVAAGAVRSAVEGFLGTAVRAARNAARHAAGAGAGGGPGLAGEYCRQSPCHRGGQDRHSRPGCHRPAARPTWGSRRRESRLLHLPRYPAFRRTCSSFVHLLVRQEGSRHNATAIVSCYFFGR